MKKLITISIIAIFTTLLSGCEKDCCNEPPDDDCTFGDLQKCYKKASR